MELGKISARQLGFLMTVVPLATVLFFMPQLSSRAVEQDAWITALIATIWGILVVLIIIALANRFPGMTLIEYLPLIVGKPVGKLLGALYTFWFVFIGSLILRQFGMFLTSAIMPYVPVEVFTVTLLTLVFYAVRSGLEVWSRVNELLLPLLVVALIVCLLLPYPHMDLRRILPMATHTYGQLISSSLVSGSWRGEIFIASMFLPALSDSRLICRNLIIAVLVVGIILTATELVTVAVFGGLNTGQMEFPILALVRMIDLFHVFSRFEVLIILIWMFGSFIKICCFVYCSTLAAAQVTGCGDFQRLLLPVSILMLALSNNAFGNMIDIVNHLGNLWPGLGLLSFELAIPMIVFLVALSRNRKRG